MGRLPRLIAYYLPQYHPIPENDLWWGDGFTEWTNVARARPLFKGHYQPHIPADLGFYDLRLPETRAAQAALASAAGIEGFCYWHYWFAGKRLLERPFNEVLATGRPDFPFCLAWANASWTGSWYGAPQKILIEQTYPGVGDHKAHFSSLLPAFSDDRYITVDGRPLFLVFQPSELDAQAIDLWQTQARLAGLKSLFFVGIIKNSREGRLIQPRGFDACTISRTNGRGTQLKPVQKALLKTLGEKKALQLYQKWFRRPFYVYDYREITPFIDVEPDLGLELFPCVMPNWDNTPRAGLDGQVFLDSRPEIFRDHLRQAFKRVEGYPEEHRIVIIKSWNEWAEGNHLEPDLKFGRGYLAAIRAELDGWRNN